MMKKERNIINRSWVIMENQGVYSFDIKETFLVLKELEPNELVLFGLAELKRS